MERVDRSEELYARIAAIPPGRRAIYNLVAIAPVIVFPVAFYVIASTCDRGGAFGTALIIFVILNCFAINGSLFWLVASHPRLPRVFSKASARKKLAIMFCVMATLLILKSALAPLLKPSLDRLDRMHAQLCDKTQGTRFATR